MKYLLGLLLLIPSIAGAVFPRGTKVVVNYRGAPGCKGTIENYHVFMSVIPFGSDHPEYQVKVFNCTFYRDDGFSFTEKEALVWVPVDSVKVRD